MDGCCLAVVAGEIFWRRDGQGFVIVNTSLLPPPPKKGHLVYIFGRK